MEETIYIIGSRAAVGVFCTMWAQALLRRRSTPPAIDADEQRLLTKRIERLEAELHALRDEHLTALEDVHERVDFAERLLTQDAPARRLPVKEVTPV